MSTRFIKVLTVNVQPDECYECATSNDFLSGITDWEEVTESQYSQLYRWAEKKNAIARRKSSGSKKFIVIFERLNLDVQGYIDEYQTMMRQEEEREARKIELEEERKKKAAKKKEDEELATLQRLREKYDVPEFKSLGKIKERHEKSD